MPFDGNGTYTLPSPAYPAVTGAVISSSYRNTLDADLANALSNVMCRDGQSSATGNLPMAGFTLTSIAAAAAAGQPVRFEQLFGAGPGTPAAARSTLEIPATALTAIGTTTGSGTAYAITANPVYTAYTAGLSVWATFHAASGADPTLNVNGLGATVNLVRAKADGSYSNIQANDIPVGWVSRVTLISATQAVVERLPKKLTVQRFTSGSGTYTTPVGCTRIRVRMVGGGGSGRSGGTFATATTGTAGGNTTFGSLTANGGEAGAGLAGAGGSFTVGMGAGFGIAGGGGAAGDVSSTAGDNNSCLGGNGGSSAWGGGGIGQLGTGGAGGAGVANSGAGGAGGGASSYASAGTNTVGGTGGGSGGYVESVIASPAASYAYAVGAGGAAAAAGTNGQASGAGGSGQIVVEEEYE